MPGSAHPSNPAATLEPATTRSDGPVTTSTTVAPAASDETAELPLTAEEEEVARGYRGYVAGRLAANQGRANPDHPALAEHAVGAQLEADRAEARRNRDRDQVFGTVPGRQHVQWVRAVEVDGARATVRARAVAEPLLVQRGTGVVIRDERGPREVTAYLVLVDGVWKVAWRTSRPAS